MRMMQVYKHIRSLLGGTNITYNLVGGDYGLATVLIHQIDFLMYLTGCDEFTLDTSNLDKAIIPAKRQGYSELTGTAVAHFENGSVGTFTCYGATGLPSFATITNDRERLCLDNLHGDIWRYATGKKEWVLDSYGIPFQSQLTTELANELFASGSCALPNYETSAKAHHIMMERLLAFLRENAGYKDDELPFT